MIRRVTKWDIAVVIIFAALSLFSVFIVYFSPFTSDIGRTVKVYTDSEVFRYELSEDSVYTVTSNGIEVEIKVEDSTVRVEKSGCPDSVCVHTGRISGPGSVIICVPAHLRIEIEGEADGDADYTIG